MSVTTPAESAVSPIRAILHPTDFSEHARPAFRLACALARDLGARLIVLHVTPPPVFPTGGMVPRAVYAAHVLELQASLRRLQAPGTGAHVEHRLVEGETVPAILAAAEAIPCQLIVMGTHGRTGLECMLTGSVAGQVMRQAHCPVATVRLPSQRPQPSRDATSGQSDAAPNDAIRRPSKPPSE